LAIRANFLQIGGQFSVCVDYSTPCVSIARRHLIPDASENRHKENGGLYHPAIS
jgi:hypothetical protein